MTRFVWGLEREEEKERRDTLGLVRSMGCAVSATRRDEQFQKRWDAFLAELEEAVNATYTRFALGISAVDVMPAQAQWEAWVTQSKELTAEHYGQSNISALYECYIACCIIGGAGYAFEDIPHQWSADGWTRWVDSAARRALSAEKAEFGRGRCTALVQNGFAESAIDNTVLPNIFTAAEARVLLAGHTIKRFLVGFLAREQRRILARLVSCNALSRAPLCKTPAQLSAVLNAIAADQLDVCGISPASTAWTCLCMRGCVISSFGQLDIERCQAVAAFLESVLEPPAAGEGNIELARFIAFVRKHPGRIFDGDLTRHRQLLSEILLSPDYVVIKRSTIEKFTVHRFLPLPWVRTHDLVGFDEDGCEVVLRCAGDKECMRIRKNDYPYMASHGLDLTSSGLHGTTDRGTVAFEMGALMPEDASAKVSARAC